MYNASSGVTKSAISFCITVLKVTAWLNKNESVECENKYISSLVSI